MRKKSSNSPSAAAVKTPDRTLQGGGKNALHLLSDHPADTSVDSFIEIMSMHHDDDDDDDGGDDVKHSPHRKSAGGREGGRGGGEGDADRSKSDASLDLSITAEEEEKVTLEDLRAVFEQSLGADEFLAEKG
jgi:hypothetical protein